MKTGVPMGLPWVYHGLPLTDFPTMHLILYSPFWSIKVYTFRYDQVLYKRTAADVVAAAAVVCCCIIFDICFCFLCLVVA